MKIAFEKQGGIVGKSSIPDETDIFKAVIQWDGTLWIANDGIMDDAEGGEPFCLFEEVEVISAP